MTQPLWITPGWPAPECVHALSTTRHGGYSQAPYASFNLSDYVGDAPDAVARNRMQLHRQGGLPSAPHWLRQVHGTRVLELDNFASQTAAPIEADAAITLSRGVVCAVQTADCLPILLCDTAGTRVGAVHAGWRGLANGVVEAALKRLDTRAEQMLAWLGPAIGADAFEVGDDVRDAFVSDGPATSACFRAYAPGKWHADLFQLARVRLQRAGVTGIFGGGRCTFRNAQEYFSYRRDHVTGRMATLIWLE
ncbi:MAG: peptidoglycan editing factor PgeF [Gammaproteobacteria bacterium]|nr:peptidoglycan editing factor PgeF [Gammaproteobacteria bacterium]